MKNSKIITALLAVLVIAAGVYLLVRDSAPDSADPQAASATITATTTAATSTAAAALTTRSGWKRYTDALYGFTFEYPSTWSLGTSLVNTSIGTTHIISVSSDIGRGNPREIQEILTFTAAPVSDRGITDVIEYSSARGGLVNVATDPVTCVPVGYTLGARDVATKVPFYTLDEASVGQGVMTEQAVLTSKKTMVTVKQISAYPGNQDVAAVLASFQFAGEAKPVVASCRPSARTASDIARRVDAANKELIIQVTAPGNGEVWPSGSSHRITWRTSSSPLKGNVALELVNRVNRRNCLLATAVAQAQAMNITVTANQNCANRSDMVVQPGDYDLYIRYPYTATDPKQNETGALYSDPANLPIRITLTEAR